MAKKPELVTQYLENVSRVALDKYQTIVRDYVRDRHGLYALYRGGKLYYVGLATNLRARLHQHLRDRHGDSWDSFSVYLTVSDKHMKDLESLALRLAKPPGNKQRGRFTHSENLHRRLRSDMKSVQRAELDSMVGVPKRRTAVRKRKPRGGRGGAKAVALAGLARPGLEIRAQIRGKQISGKVLGDGTIRARGHLFRSPSKAAAHFAGHAKNGWRTWLYEKSPGEWVSIDLLRR